MFVQPLQAGEGAAAEAEFTVVIVLKNPAALLRGELQQGAAALQAHHMAERILMRGRDVDQPWPALLPVGRRWRHALQVHRDRLELEPGGLQRPARAPVAGVFHPGLVAVISEQARGQIERLLRARGDEHLLGRHPHRARQAEVLRNRHAQRHIAAFLAVIEQVAVEAAPILGLQFLPELNGEFGKLDLAGREGLHLKVRRSRLRGEQIAAQREFARRAAVRTGGLRQLAPAYRRTERAEFRQGLGNESAAALARGEVAFRRELVDGRHDRIAREIQVARQIAGGRQLYPGGDATRQNGAA